MSSEVAQSEARTAGREPSGGPEPIIRVLLSRVQHAVGSALVWMLVERHASRGLAVTRILVGTAILGILVVNFGSRHLLWGPASGWHAPYRPVNSWGDWLLLLETESPWRFTLYYLILMGLALAVILGWRTRLTCLLLALGLPALVQRAALVSDQGDNIARIGLLLMVFMSVADHWSLDARRRRIGAQRDPSRWWARIWYGLPVLPRWLVTTIHNAALIALACQIFILYTASALYKVQGDRWQDGTALHYPMSLPEYSVFPAINAIITADPVVLTLITYFSVYVQLFFAVGLLHPLSRRVVLIGVILLHGGIAVLMGLPWFSLAMLAFDAIFISDRTYRGIEARFRALRRPSARGRVESEVGSG